MHKNTAFFIAVLGCFLALCSCRKDKFDGDVSQIAFSTDTLFFDTVFTELGTATRNVKIYNRGNKDLRIDKIQLKSGSSVFRFNADGLPGDEAEEIEIPAKDSIFVFLEATIDPNGGSTPIVVEESLECIVNNQSKSLPIFAWGQDAIYYRPQFFLNPNLGVHVLEPNAIWTPEKPIVVFGYVAVDSLNSLTIQPGTQVHFHSGGGLWVYKDALLNAQGTQENPIVFQGDRLESSYDELPGQWDRIWINESSQGNHRMTHCIIKNSIIGLQVEPVPFPYNELAPVYPNFLELENITIRNQSLAGILSHNYRIVAGNVEIYNSGQFSVALTGGGQYQLSHFTIANFWANAVRSDPAFYVSNVFNGVVRPIVDSYLENSIITGTEEKEFGFDFFQENGEPETNFQLRNNIIKSNEAITGISLDEINYNDPLLEGSDEEGRPPSAQSPAINAGISTNFATDIEGKPRDNQPDLGAYELE